MPNSNINALLDGGMIKALTKAGDVVRNAAIENVGKNNLPKVIADNMKLSEVRKEGQDRYSIAIEISLEPDAAPMAAAFELGSGIHGQKGNKYPIVAKDANALVFTFKSGDFGYFPKPIPVNHPGVPARPYLEPAAKDKANEVAEIMGDALLEVASIAFDLILT